MLPIGSVSIVNNTAINTVNTSRRTDSTVAGSKAENEKLNRQIKKWGISSDRLDDRIDFSLLADQLR